MVWVGRDLEDYLVPTCLPWAGTPSTRPGSLKPTLRGSYLARLKNPKCLNIFLGSFHGSESEVYWFVSDMEVAHFVTCTFLYCTLGFFLSGGLLFSQLISGSLC